MTGAGAAGLARLCEQLAVIRGFVDSRGRLPELERILEALRAGGDAARLTAEADELLRRCGIARGLGGLRGGHAAALPRLGAGHPVEEAHVCPAGGCDRVELDPGGTCAIHGRPLRLLRL
ncbi:hypothetical protein [Streptomyces hoynatensis]|uniref:Uncharacterized protein n=1 Tax=Streptomyces hoynatensis TaxID=1141874 RepID=A0A3A9ZDY8_9ACTN|nr:hypothetical protein [Streptomyces hoynatensis]RKN45566.1 hypothetical protein D7294_03535 [Streptomyces hoynatensis]